MMMNPLAFQFPFAPILTLGDWTNNRNGKSSSVCLKMVLEEDRDPNTEVLDKQKQCSPCFT